MKINKLIKELEVIIDEEPSSIDYENDLMNRLTKIEKTLDLFDENRGNTLSFLIDENIKNNDYQRLDSTVRVIYSIYEFEDEEERKISLKIIEAIKWLIGFYQANKEVCLHSNFYNIFDLYFHNPGLIQELNLEEQKKLFELLPEIAKINYSEDLGFELINRKILGCLVYFSNALGLKQSKDNYRSIFEE